MTTFENAHDGEVILASETCAGRKRWALYPPGKVPPGVMVHVHASGEPDFRGPTSLQWFLEVGVLTVIGSTVPAALPKGHCTLEGCEGGQLRRRPPW